MNDRACTTSTTTEGVDDSGDEPVTPETEAAVRTLLAVSGLVYAITDVRYGSPGLIFDADPALVTWA